jgi:formylmethanofuran dehydrogenase subunit D
MEGCNMELILNTVRKVDNDQTKEFAFGDTKSLEENLAIAFLNPTNMKKLNLKNEECLNITNDVGSIVVKALEDEDVPEGSIFLPVSIWANQLTKVEGNELLFKNIKVNVNATDKAITKYEDIISKIRGV